MRGFHIIGATNIEGQEVQPGMRTYADGTDRTYRQKGATKLNRETIEAVAIRNIVRAAVDEWDGTHPTLGEWIDHFTATRLDQNSRDVLARHFLLDAVYDEIVNDPLP